MRFPLDKTLMRITPDKKFGPSVARRLYVYDFGTTNEAVGYTTADEDDLTEITYPLISNEAGQFVDESGPLAWFPEGVYTTYSPDDISFPVGVFAAGGDPIVPGGIGSAIAAIPGIQQKLTGLYTPLMFGAVGDGVADDHDAIQAALDAAATSNGGRVVLGKMFGWNGTLTISDGVLLEGVGFKGAEAGAPLGSGLKALGGTSKLLVGSWAGGHSHPRGVRDIIVDGNNTGAASLVELQCVTAKLEGVQVSKSAGKAIYLNAAQNNTLVGVDVFGCDVGMSLDHGSGGNAFIRCEHRGNRVGIELIESTPSDPSDNAYPWGPADNKWLSGIVETSLATEDVLLDAKAGANNHFFGTSFSDNNSNLDNDSCVVVSNDAFPSIATSVHFDSCFFAGGNVSLSDAIRIVGNNLVRLTGETIIQYCTDIFVQDTGVGVLSLDGTLYELVGTTNRFATRNGGSTVSWLVPKNMGDNYTLDAESTTVMLSKRKGDAGGRFSLDRDGTFRWYDGTNFTSRGTLQWLNTPSRIVLNSGVATPPILRGLGDGTGATDATTKGQMDTELALHQLLSEKGAASGYASLDGAGKVPNAQLPAMISNPDVAKGYKAAVQSINNNAQTAFTLDSERYDTNGLHDTVTNNTRLTIVTAGVYEITAYAAWQVNTVGSRAIYLKKNGGSTDGQDFWYDSRPATQIAGHKTGQSLSTHAKLAAGDYIEGFGFQDSGGALNVTANVAVAYLGVG